MAIKPITVNGIIFPSLKLASEHYGQHYGNAARRVRAGWTAEEALGLVPHKRKMLHQGKQIVTRVGIFRTMQEAADHFGIDYSTLQRRIELGWTPDQAVGIEEHSRPARAINEIDCDGKHYPNAWALARAYGKAERLVANRIKCGWTPEQAVEIEDAPPRFRNQPKGATNKHWKKIEIVDDKEYPATEEGEYKLYLITNKADGKQYVGITINPLWQRFNGHKRSARMGVKTKLYNAMRFHGDENFTIELIRSDAHSFVELQQQEVEEIAKRGTIEKGYNVSPGGSIGTPDRITVGGMTFPSKGAAADYFGIEPTVFNIRIARLNWTPEQAAEIEPREKFARNKIQAAGVRYASMMEAAAAYGLDYQLVWSRIKSNGWTIEQALDIAPPPKTARSRGVEVAVYGISFPTLRVCAKHHGVSPDSIRNKMKDGLTLEEAIDLILSNKKKYRKM